MKNLLKLLLIISQATLLYTSCKMTSDFVWPTPEEQSKLAGAIIIGQVFKQTQDKTTGETLITLKKSQYIKGCGPRTVVIKGYTSSASCGVDSPDVHSQVLVFVCQESVNRRWWSLNQIRAHAGHILNPTVEDITKVKEIVQSEFECPDCCGSITKCGGEAANVSVIGIGNPANVSVIPVENPDS